METNRKIVLFADIKNGVTKRYTLRPQPCDPPMVTRWKLSCITPSHEAEYLVSMDQDANIRCNCPAGTLGRPCKHNDALVAAGLLDPEKMLSLRRLALDLDGQQRQLQDALAEMKQLREAATRKRKPRRIQPTS